MNERDLKTADLTDLLERYRGAAAEHARASEDGDYEIANRHHDVVANVYRELRNRGEERTLLALLSAADASVRSWAGAHALEFSPAEAERALEGLSAEGGVAGFNAQMTLETWRKGDLQFP